VASVYAHIKYLIKESIWNEIYSPDYKSHRLTSILSRVYIYIYIDQT